MYHYSDFWHYRSLLYYGKFLKESGKSKNKWKTIYPKNHKNFKNSECRVQFYWFLLKKREKKSEIFYILTRNLPIESGVGQWSHLLMIPLHCLWVKSNNRTRSQCKCDVTLFCFCFDFVRSHARCGCCFTVCWRGWGEGVFKIGRPGHRCKKVLDLDGQGGWGVLKIRLFSWRSYVYRP